MCLFGIRFNSTEVWIILKLKSRFLLSHNVSLPTHQVAGIPSPLFFSLLAPSSACLLELLKNGFNVRVKGNSGRSLLQILACTGRSRHFEDTALQLLNKGVDIDAKDQEGCNERVN